MDILVGISFPTPIPYNGDEGQEGPPGNAFEATSIERVRQAFRNTSSKKSPGPVPLQLGPGLHYSPYPVPYPS